MLAARPPSAPSRTGRRLRRFDADEARRDRGQDQHRLEPLAEHDDRRVGDHGRLRRRVAERGGDVGELVVEHRAGRLDLSARRVAGDQLREPRTAQRTEPDQALDIGGERRIERHQAALRPELEDRVQLDAGLLRLAVAPGGDLLLEPVERDLDQVEVALVGLLLPGVREQLRQALVDRLALRFDGVHLAARPAGSPGRRAARRRAPSAGSATSAVVRASIRASVPLRSAKAACAAVENAIPSWISNATVTRLPSTPWPYSIGISETNLASWLARRACSSAVKGAAVKPASRLADVGARSFDGRVVVAQRRRSQLARPPRLHRARPRRRARRDSAERAAARRPRRGPRARRGGPRSRAHPAGRSPRGARAPRPGWSRARP